MDDALIEFDITDVKGTCPVQAWGTIEPYDENGDPCDWFFRARGNSWTFFVWQHGNDPVLPHYRFQAGGIWGSVNYAAGWMTHDDATELILKAIELYAVNEYQTLADEINRMAKEQAADA